jgi:hypothetical protein
MRSDAARRRRRCDDCGKSWPTLESLDKRRFLREVGALGIDPIDLDLGEVA